MRPETIQLMEIQSAVDGELAIKSKPSCHEDKSGKTGDMCTTFKRPLSCCQCGKAFTTKSQLNIHGILSMVRNHSAAQSVTRHLPHQAV